MASEAGTRYMMGLYIQDHSSEDINGSTVTPKNYSASTEPTKEGAKTKPNARKQRLIKSITKGL